MARLELPELFDLMASSLTANVLPHVSDHYAKAQLRAATELLTNLGRRVEWQPTLEHARAELVRTALASDALSGSNPIDTRALEDADLATLLSHLGVVIDSLYIEEMPQSGRAESLAEIWRVVRGHFDAESERMRTAMLS
jgi:hypothetical protein